MRKVAIFGVVSCIAVVFGLALVPGFNFGRYFQLLDSGETLEIYGQDGYAWYSFIKDSTSRKIKHGEYRSFYASGARKSLESYSFGKPVGMLQTWDKNGNLLSQAQFLDGKPVGTSRAWFSSGQLAEEIRYERGMKNGIAKRWREDGTLLLESPFVDDLPHGTWIGRNSYGVPTYEESYKMGVKDGVSKTWYDDGALSSIVQYKDGLKIGMSKYYGRNGKSILECHHDARHPNDSTATLPMEYPCLD